jgi:hypothetical protein
MSKFIGFSNSDMKHYRTPRTLGEAFGHGVDWHIEPKPEPRSWRRRWLPSTFTLTLLAGVLVILANCAWSLR